MIEEMARFPYECDDKGRCPQLDENNLCKIYDTRPLICNVEKVHENFFSQVDQETFFSHNEKYCHALIEKAKANEGA